MCYRLSPDLTRCRTLSLFGKNPNHGDVAFGGCLGVCRPLGSGYELEAVSFCGLEPVPGTTLNPQTLPKPTHVHPKGTLEGTTGMVAWACMPPPTWAGGHGGIPLRVLSRLPSTKVHFTQGCSITLNLNPKP